MIAISEKGEKIKQSARLKLLLEARLRPIDGALRLLNVQMHFLCQILSNRSKELLEALKAFKAFRGPFQN